MPEARESPRKPCCSFTGSRATRGFHTAESCWPEAAPYSGKALWGDLQGSGIASGWYKTGQQHGGKSEWEASPVYEPETHYPGKISDAAESVFQYHSVPQIKEKGTCGKKPTGTSDRSETS